jgi:hypothetical protein
MGVLIKHMLSLVSKSMLSFDDWLTVENGIFHFNMGNCWCSSTFGVMNRRLVG